MTNDVTEDGGNSTLRAPYPFFGGKSKVASLVWQRFGNVRNLVDPFCGSMAILLGRPRPFEGTETCNDADGMICNFFRAVQSDPDAVAHHADFPCLENELHARHAWLVARKDSLQARLEGDPEFYDAKVAGWWVWGCCLWIGSGWCSGQGPWQVVDGQLVKVDDAKPGAWRQLMHLGNAGQGIHRKRISLSNNGRGIHRPCEGDGGVGTCAAWSAHLREMMGALADRLRRVRVCCGDWTRVCGPTPTVQQGLTAVFLDPPYADTAGRDTDLYRVDCLHVAHAVREWAIAHGDDPRMRICLAGYDTEHVMPASWDCVAWKAKGGYGSQRKGGAGNGNAGRERLWFNASCLSARGRDSSPRLFA